MKKTSPLRDRELVGMLADEPELLAIADAFVETQREGHRKIRPARGWKPLVVVAAVIVSLAATGVGVAAGVGAFDSPTMYSASQVENAFASQGIQLQDVTPNEWKRVLVMLDGRPAHAVYVYVEIVSCKCALISPMPDAETTHNGNLEVLYDPNETAAVTAALQKLDQG